jgi:hypothetical protein
VVESMSTSARVSATMSTAASGVTLRSYPQRRNGKSHYRRSRD